jgi:hypothetical protein
MASHRGLKAPLPLWGEGWPGASAVRGLRLGVLTPCLHTTYIPPNAVILMKVRIQSNKALHSMALDPDFRQDDEF